MPDFRRLYHPGGTYFFTVVSDRRAPILCTDTARPILRDVLVAARDRWPFHIDAIVLLPDHLHTLWTMPTNDHRYPMRWGWIKKEFTKRWLLAGGDESLPSAGRLRDGRRGVLQPKYWEHFIRDERDFERHFDDIHYNPVKHGLVRFAREWPFSSIHRWVRDGHYPDDWGCGPIENKPFTFDDIEATAME